MQKKSLIILILLLILLIPILLYEYLLFLWFWFGDGVFSLIATPLTYVICLTIFLIAKNKLELRGIKNAISKIAFSIISPVITMLIVSIVAEIFGVDITIQ